MSGPDKKRSFPYYSEVQEFELQRRRLEDDPSRWVLRRLQQQLSRTVGILCSQNPWIGLLSRAAGGCADRQYVAGRLALHTAELLSCCAAPTTGMRQRRGCGRRGSRAHSTSTMPSQVRARELLLMLQLGH